MHKTPICGSKEKTTDICSVPVVYVPGSGANTFTVKRENSLRSRPQNAKI